MSITTNGLQTTADNVKGLMNEEVSATVVYAITRSCIQAEPP
jgi:hypothetical protein